MNLGWKASSNIEWRFYLYFCADCALKKFSLQIKRGSDCNINYPKEENSYRQNPLFWNDSFLSWCHQMSRRKTNFTLKNCTNPAFSIHLSIGSHCLHGYAQTKPLQFLLKQHKVMNGLLSLNLWRRQSSVVWFFVSCSFAFSSSLSSSSSLSGTQLQWGGLPLS